MSRSRALAFGAGFLVAGLATINLGAQSSVPDPGAVQDAVWVAIGGPGQILKLASADGTALLELDAPHVRAVAAGTDRVWTAGASIRVFDFAGVQTLELALPGDAKDPDEHDDAEECEDERHDHGHPAISLDLRDGSAWISGGKSAFHFSSDGTLLRTITLSKRILGISFDPSHERVWLGTKKSLTAYDAGGALLADLPLPVQSRLRSFSSDPLTGDVWASIADDLFRYEGGTFARTGKRVKHVRQVAATTDGRVWAAAKERLFLFDAAFTQLSSATLDRKVVALATLPDVGDGSAWAATRHSLSRISTGGGVVYSVALDEVGAARGVSLSATRDRIPPTLLVESPPNDSFVADQTPTVVVRFSDVGSGVAADTLRFELSGEPLSVVCSDLPGGAACTPTLPLPEGLVELTATVEDVAHNLSAPAHAVFTVDVTPPKLAVDFPPAAPDLLTSELVIEIRGSVNEPVVLTINGTSVPVEFSGTFSLLQSLQEGVNVFEFVATDRAALVAVATRRVVRDTIPPSPVEQALVFVGESGGTNATITIDPGGAEPGATLEVRVTRTNEVFTTVVGGDGGAVLTFNAIPGEEFVVTLIDEFGNRSAPSTFHVPTGPEIPPDPVPPPISGTAVTDIFAANSFLFTGPDALQRGVSAGTIEPRRIAILRGRVLDRAGSGVGGVRVQAVGRTELGFAMSRVDGAFEFCVNGGGVVTLAFTRNEYLEVHRPVSTSWRKWAILDDVILTALDPAVTAIDLSGVAFTQVARGSQVVDGDGTRRMTLIFPPATTGELVFLDDHREVLPAASVHITEFSSGPKGPDAMPAPLPASSHYTYSFELTAEEARDAVRLEFNQDVAGYSENFLGFPNGIMPVGSYDRQRALWIPENNGLVLEILSVDGGVATLSLDDSGAPADEQALADAGISFEERVALASLYSPSQSLFRSAIRHFTQPVDWNWAPRLPVDAVSPRQGVPRGYEAESEACESSGSVIECENQTLKEAIPVVGAGTSLVYSADRAGRRNATLDVPVSVGFSSMPASLRGIEVEVEVEGQREVRQFPPLPNLRADFTFSGTDYFGRKVQGARPATIRIRYQYEAEYGFTNVARSFGSPGSSSVGISVRPDAPFEIVQTLAAEVGGFDATASGLGGLSLSNVHVYSPDENAVYLGNGARRGPEEIGPAIQTVVEGPFALLLVGRDGSLYVDGVGGTIVRRTPEGTVEPFIGGDTRPLLTSGCALASEVRVTHLVDPSNVLVEGPDGAIYAAGSGTITRIDRDSGIACVVAGTGVSGFAGDGGPALQARLTVHVMSVGPDGSIWFSQGPHVQQGDRLRRVSPDGFITTVAGGNGNDNAGDGGPALLAKIGVVTSIVHGPGESVYIADRGPFSTKPSIRRIRPDGIIERFAGTGLGSSSRPADGAPALSAGFLTSWLQAAADGSILFSMRNEVRAISPQGTFATITGSRLSGSTFTPDGIPGAKYTNFSNDVGRFRLGPDGLIYLVDLQSGVGPFLVRVFEPTFPGFSGEDVLVASGGGGSIFRFDAAGRHVETRDPLTGAVRSSNAFDADGRLASISDADGNTTSIVRSPSGSPLAILAPGGQRTDFSLDAQGRIESITNPAGEVTQLDWAPDGLLNSFTNPRGKTTTFTFGSLGALTHEADPAGGSQAFVRTGERPDFAVTRTTALGRSTRYRVEDLPSNDQRRTQTLPNGTGTTQVRQVDEGRLRISPDGTSVTVQRAPDPRFGLQSPVTSSNRVATPGGRVALTTRSRVASLSNPSDPSSLQVLSDSTVINGRPYTTVFDRSSLTSSSTTPEGRSSVATLDEQGRVTRSQRGSLAPNFFSYDANGLLSQVVTGEGVDARRVLFEYDGARRLTAVTDPLDRVTRFDHDDAGRVIEQLFPDGGIARASYDANSNVVSLSPPDRPAHRFEYSPVDLEAAYLPPPIPDGGTNLTSSSHDLDRAPTVETRADGTAVSRGYDSAGRLSSLEHAHEQLGYAYHPTTGRLAEISSTKGGTLSFALDGPLPTGETLSGPVSGFITRTFDNDFRLASESVNGAGAVTFGYDLDGVLVQAGDLTLSRDLENGLPTGSELGGVVETRQHNGFGETEHVAFSALAVPILDSVYARDKLGRMTRKTETIEGVTTVTEYAYDLAGRLETVVVDGVLVSGYSWDGNGNRLSASTASGTALASYDAQDRLLSHGGATFTFTAAGELATKTDASGTASYQYDPLGNLRRVDLPDGRVLEYVIDGRNRRVGKKVDSVLVQGFLYHDQLEPVAELDGAGNVVSRFVYGSKAHVPDYMVKAGMTYRIVTDHLGSPRLVINTATGAIAQRMDFDEWGNVTLDTAPGFQPFGFAGGILDAHTGLTRFGARDYSAAEGRWTAKDPGRFDDGGNLYLYCLGDPVNRIDVSGRSSVAAQYGWWVATRAWTPWGPTMDLLDVAGAAWEFKTNKDALYEVGPKFDWWKEPDSARRPDWYYHCMANCESSDKGLYGRGAAACLGYGNEIRDAFKKGNTWEESEGDLMVNWVGRQGSLNGSCSERCSGYAFEMP